MDMDLENRLNYQAEQSAKMDTSHLEDLIPGKSAEDIFADIQKRAEFQAAARDALKKKPTAVTSDASSPDHMMIDDVPSTSDKGKAKEDFIQQDNTNSSGSSVLTPVSTEPPKQRIVLNRSQRFRIYILTSAFKAPNFAQIKKFLQTVFQGLSSLTDIYERKIKQDKDKFVSFTIVEFFTRKDGQAALALTIPDTESKFQIINERSQLADLVNAAAKPQDSSDNASGSGTSQAPVPKIHNDFADRKAIRQEQDKRTVKVLDIPLNFNSADVSAAHVTLWYS